LKRKRKKKKKTGGRRKRRIQHGQAVFNRDRGKKSLRGDTKEKGGSLFDR